MDQFILYSYYRSSASYRVRIGLNLKGIRFEYKSVHLLKGGGEQHLPQYRHLNPIGEVPTLVHNGRALGQSMAILEYLDDIHPQTPLFPMESYQRALVRQACEIVNCGIQPSANLKILQYLEVNYGVDQNGKNEWARHWMRDGLSALNRFLTGKAGTFCFGGRVTAADLFLVPQMYNAIRYELNINEFPTLARVYEHCIRLDAFRKAAPDAQPDAQ